MLPDNAQDLPAAAHQKAKSFSGRMPAIKVGPDAAAISDAADLISKAERLLIIVGYGARSGIADVTALAEKLNAPMVTTFKAKGLIGDNHPLSAGVLGRSGTPIASWFMNEADLLIVFGASFSDHTGIEPSKPIIQIDTDPMRIGKRHPVTLPLFGDVAESAKQISATLSPVAGIDQRAELAERWRIWREEKARRVNETRGKGLSAAALFDVLSEQAPEDAIFAVDVGNNTYSFGRYFETSGKQSVLMSGYLGSIGFSLPAAMGAWAATQDKPAHKGRKVISVSGDGGFGQYAMELTTAVKYGMNITHILMNNGELGKISKEQRAAEFEVWQTSLHNPPFAAFARACGAMGHRATTREEFDTHLKEALAHNGPSLIEVMTDAELV